MIEDDFAVRAFSQEGEDIFLSRLFEYRQPGFYVDVGAHHPYRFSNTCLLHKRGWRGINIDPTPGVKEMFDEARPGDINLDRFVSLEDGDVIEFDLYSEGALNSGHNARQNRFNELHRETRKITGVSLATLLRQYLPAGQHIDLLSIDTEGFDGKVVRSNDWTAFRPSVVMVEAFLRKTDLLHHPMVALMAEKHYELRACLYATMVFLPVGVDRYDPR